MAAPRSLPLDALPKDITLLIKRDGPHCVWCSRRLGLEPKDATREHVVARSQGGKDQLENYLLACRPCNRRRRSKAPLAYLLQCERQGLKARRDLVERALERVQAHDAVRPSKLSRRASRERRARLRGAEA